MKIKLSVIKDNCDINIIEGVSNKTGNQYKIINQDVFLHLGGPFPEKVSVNLPDENSKLLVGEYELELPLKVNDRNRLEINERLIFQNIKK